MPPPKVLELAIFGQNKDNFAVDPIFICDISHNIQAQSVIDMFATLESDINILLVNLLIPELVGRLFVLSSVL